MKKPLLLLSLPTILLVFVSGCSSAPTDKSMSAVSAESQAQLLGAAQSIEKSLLKLAAAQEVQQRKALDIEQLMSLQGGMSQPVNLDWSGPIAPLLQKIADLGHYQFKVLGIEPPLPILVSVTAKGIPLAQVLKDADLQVGKRADIMVYPSNRVIELRYASM